MTNLRSQLAPVAHLMRDPNRAEAKKVMSKAWHDHGILTCSLDDFHGWADQKQVQILAEKLYGKRKGDMRK